jgi:hypothetical protein
MLRRKESGVEKQDFLLSASLIPKSVAENSSVHRYLETLNPGVEIDIVRLSSVAEPVERQLFAGAGAEVFLARLQSRVCKFLQNVTKTLIFSYKNYNFVALYFKEPFCLSFMSFKNMKIF